jgi:hypothetical protein
MTLSKKLVGEPTTRLKNGRSLQKIERYLSRKCHSELNKHPPILRS